MTEYDSALLRRVAVESDTDPRTVKRVLDGKKTQGLPQRRIKRVLDRLSLEVLEKAPTAIQPLKMAYQQGLQEHQRSILIVFHRWTHTLPKNNRMTSHELVDAFLKEMS